MAVDFHLLQDHLGFTAEGFAAGGAQVLLEHQPVRRDRRCVTAPDRLGGKSNINSPRRDKLL